MHLLQIQNSHGLFSNDFIFHVKADTEAVAQDERPGARGEDIRSPREALGARLREMVEAEKLTGEEALRIYFAAFPEEKREQGGDGERARERDGERPGERDGEPK
jgi:hypothetical protein